jgi:hypothetical protein
MTLAHKKAGRFMKKFWNIFGWMISIILQILISFLLLELLKLFFYPDSVRTTGEFLSIPLAIWVSFFVGIFGIGMLSLLVRKVTPLNPGLRLLSTAVMIIIPLSILVFLGLTVGIENQKDFEEIVLGRMVTYYTQLTVVFSLLGFYIPTWFKVLQPKTKKNDK